MITEDYVSFEVAKLLKEKGFEINTNLDYWKIGEDGTKYFMCSIGAYTDDESNPYAYYRPKNSYPCPTHQMAMKWLREVYNTDIVIDAAIGMLGVKVYVPFISTYKPLKDDPSKVHQIKRGIYYNDDHGVIPALQHFDSYEEAVEAALKYYIEKKLHTIK